MQLKTKKCCKTKPCLFRSCRETYFLFRMAGYHIKLLNCSLSLLEVEGSGTVQMLVMRLVFLMRPRAVFARQAMKLVKKCQLWQKIIHATVTDAVKAQNNGMLLPKAFVTTTYQTNVVHLKSLPPLGIVIRVCIILYDKSSVFLNLHLLYFDFVIMENVISS